MALYLVQHGKSLSEEQDPERGLSQEGYTDVNRIAEVARSYGVQPAAIKHSGKKERGRRRKCLPKRFWGMRTKPSRLRGSVLSMMSSRLQIR